MKQFAICVLVLLMAERQAHAYADPGSGALLWQLLVGGAVAGMFYIRRLWGWLRRNKRATHE